MSARWWSRRLRACSPSSQQQQQLALPSSVADRLGNLDQQQPLACSDWNDYHQRQEAAGAVDEGNSNGNNSRRPPCRSRETASTSQRGAYSRSMPGVIPILRGDVFSERQEEHQRATRAGAYSRQREMMERTARNSRAASPSPAAGGGGSARASPGGAAFALQDCPTIRSQQEQQQQHMRMEMPMAEGGIIIMSATGCNDTNTDENRTSPYAAPSSSPTPAPPAPPPPPPPRSPSVSPQTHTHRGSHQQQLQRLTPAVAAESGSPSYLSGGDGEERRPSLTFVANWPHATDRCDGSSQTEPEREQQAQNQHQQSPHSASGNRQ